MFSHNSLQEDQHNRNVKSSFLVVVVAFAFLVLVGRLFFLQVLMYDENLRLSESNRMRQIVVKANRGNILSRDHEILVQNRVSNHIMIEPYKVEGLRSIQRIDFNADSLSEAFLNSQEYAEKKALYDTYLEEWIVETMDSIFTTAIEPNVLKTKVEKLKSDSLYLHSIITKHDSSWFSLPIKEIAQKLCVADVAKAKRDEQWLNLD